MAQIRITPDEMRARSGEVHRQRDTFEGVISSMGSIISQLQTEWEGEASRSFYDQFERLRPSFQQMKELLDTLGIQLKQTGDALEQLDSDIAGQFR
ncbi:MAG: WXG100 family type VII secretion target [Defluviitaleaceae bacterium]|nr:WXG100 family type VII secretion target [Defluviitaleaceae bacterium]